MKSSTSYSSLHSFGWCVVLLLVSTQSWGQECVGGNCSNGQGTWNFADGAQYTGEFRADLFHGQGEILLPSGDRFVVDDGILVFIVQGETYRYRKSN